MGVTCQVLAVPADQLDRFDGDAGEVLAHLDEHESRSEPGESLWLDKAGLGILEALGVVTGDAEPPAAWVLGAHDLGTGDGMSRFLTSGEVAEVSAWVAAMSDEAFERLASANEFDTDTDYLGHHFGQLREFYAMASTRQRAVVVLFSV